VKTQAGKSGQFTIRIVIASPEGTASDYNFEGNDRLDYSSLAPDIPGGGAFAFYLEPAAYGTYWISVFLNGDSAIRWPVTVREFRS
jgi:hypothetical protein